VEIALEPAIIERFTMIVDHLFLFAIGDEMTGTILLWVQCSSRPLTSFFFPRTFMKNAGFINMFGYLK